MRGRRRVVELHSEEMRRSEGLRSETSLDGRLEEEEFFEESEGLRESGRFRETREYKTLSLRPLGRNATVPYHFFYRGTTPREVKTLLGIGAGMVVYSILPQQVRNVADHVVMPIVAGGSAVLLTYLSIMRLDRLYEGLYNRLFDKHKDSKDR